MILRFSLTKTKDQGKVRCFKERDPVLLFLGLFENTQENLENFKDFQALPTFKTLEN